MTRPLWAQIKAVVRLEIKKTFFAKRGLWIYVLALLPLALFVGHALVDSHHRDRSVRLAMQNERPLTSQDLHAVRFGMTNQEVVALLGKPPLQTHWREHRPLEQGGSSDIPHDNYHYSDGTNDLYVGFSEGKVESVFISEGHGQGEESIVFAGVFQFFYLRLAVFFGCLGVFMNLFRGEVLDKSLHFYFLAPVRREVLMLGKFIAGLLATCAIFCTSELLQIVAFTWRFSPSARDAYLYHNHGLAHAAAYLGITALACLGYGSFFLAAGMLFRNPILPAAAILVWEAINPFLPSLLQKISVIHYLKSLCPVNVPSSPGTPPVLALLISNPDPVSAPVAVLGVVVLSLGALYLSGLQVRRMEINYTTE